MLGVMSGCHTLWNFIINGETPKYKYKRIPIFITHGLEIPNVLLVGRKQHNNMNVFM
jgi:hypothetical protein